MSSWNPTGRGDGSHHPAPSSASGPEGEGECAVCLGAHQQPCRTACGHTFCFRCVSTVMRTTRPYASGKCPLCRARISMFTTADCATGSLLGSPVVTSIFGSVYVQGAHTAELVGVASYHFESAEECYIKYDSPMIAEWLLDDGSKPPVKKYFIDASFDPEGRVFRGEVRWEPSFEGDRRWVYEMVFSEDLEGIVGGTLRRFDSLDDDATPKAIDMFGRGGVLHYLRLAPPPTTIFPSVYIQHGHEGLASYHFESPTCTYISYTSEHCNAFPPLEDGSRPPPQKHFEDVSYDEETRTFRGSIRWHPVTWQNNCRWDYTMIFSEDFETIGGSITAFKRDDDGNIVVDNVTEFGDQLVYFRVHDYEQVV